MTHYKYTISDSYKMPHDENTNISLSLRREYDIFVDSEPNQDKEKRRAINVLRGIK